MKIVIKKLVKALAGSGGHKYIKRLPKPGGGYRYVYKESGGAKTQESKTPEKTPSSPSRLKMATDRMGQLYREGKNNTPEMDAAHKEYQEALKEARQMKEKRDGENSAPAIERKKQEGKNSLQGIRERFTAGEIDKNQLFEELKKLYKKNLDKDMPVKMYDRIVYPQSFPNGIKKAISAINKAIGAL
jgi:hypothetical protein